MTTLSGNVGADPWALLTADTGHDTRRSGGAHYWNTRRSAPGPAPSGNRAPVEMVYPYNFKAFTFPRPRTQAISFDQCAEHGFVFRASTFSWRGTPGSDDVATSKLTVQSSSEVTAVDDLGG